MSDDDIPKGHLFSHVYLERGEPTLDSPSFRSRLAAYVLNCYGWDHDGLARLIRNMNIELGLNIQRVGVGREEAVHKLFEHPKIEKILDAITIVFRLLQVRDQEYDGEDSAEWLAFVARAMREENVGYRVDEQGGVHYFQDEEFERNRVAALSQLGQPRYGAVNAEFEKAHALLVGKDVDTKAAMRSVFEAVEILLKLMIGDNNVKRLGSAEVRKYLGPIVEEMYAGDAVALNAAKQMLTGLCNWIDAGHQYRHGQEVEKRAAPPLHLAVLYLSQGASFLRWMIAMDNRRDPSFTS